jgi:cytochrome c-type biogenesis protein CcmE
MKRKQRRLIIIAACGVGLSCATALTLNAFQDSVVFFMTPADIAERGVPDGRTIRLGGMVEAGSLKRTLHDKKSIAVAYTGILPDLFREGQGVVALGTLTPDHAFHAQEVLAKHDETYMPKDVAEALKKRGYWNPAKGPPPPAASWNAMTASKGAPKS